MVKFKTGGRRFQRSRLLLRLACGILILVLVVARRQQGSSAAGARAEGTVAQGGKQADDSASAAAAAQPQGLAKAQKAEVIGKYKVALGEGLEEEKDLLDEPIPEDCFPEPHADYKGPDGALTWGLTYKLSSAAQCCQACKDFKPTADGKFCNIWVFCPDPSGACWSPDIHDHRSGECWLKFQKNWDNNVDRSATNLEVNRRGAFAKEFREEHKTAPEMLQALSTSTADFLHAYQTGMGIFDRLRGRRPEQAEQDPAAAAAAAAVEPTLDLGQKEALHDPSRTISTEVTPGVSFRHEEQTRLYNPYEGLGAALDRTRGSAPAFKLPSQPEFLFSEEALVRKRSWSENLTYYTGAGYLGGALLGGGKGAYKAITSPVAVAGVDTTRLRVNQLLNTSGKLGRGAGNALGVLGLFFASFESLFSYLADAQVPDEIVTLGAGAATGALFRSVRGPRQAAVAGALGTVGAGLLLTGRRYINRGL